MNSAVNGATASDVVIAGAGPVGLWLSSELALAGVRCTVLDKRPERSPWSRALTLHARTLEVLAMRGVVDQWLAEGTPVPTTHYGMLHSRIDLHELDTDYPYTLFLPQLRTEELIESRARSAGVEILRGVEVTGVVDAEDRVVVAARAEGESVEYRPRYLVGCDGRHSAVRDALGIDYLGAEPAVSAVLGDVRLDTTEDLLAVTRHSDAGAFYAVQIDVDRHRLIGIDHGTPDVGASPPLEFDEFRERIERIAGSDYGMYDPSWLTRIGGATYQADHYRRGRTFLAGDAAHVHFPMSGQGLNLGLQDAMNLGWKLAAAVNGEADDALLDTYVSERMPVGAAVIEDTLSQLAIVIEPGRQGRALRSSVATALSRYPDLNGDLALSLSGIGVTYEHGGHPATGDRVPNLTLGDGSRMFDRLRDGRFCVIGLEHDALTRQLGHGPVDALTVVAAPSRELERLGANVIAALVRPDGHVAWAFDGRADGGDDDRAASLSDALGEYLPRLVATR